MNSYINPIINIIIKETNTNCPYKDINKLKELHGKSKDISISKTKNNMPITKNLMEKGCPG